METTGVIDALVKILSAIAIAAASSWITVQLSINKFRSERWWEKKVKAYECVIEAFHNSKEFYSEHMIAEEERRKVSDERDAELRKLSKEAKDQISRASDIGSFILSKEALEILARYHSQLASAPRGQTWYEYLDTDLSLTNSYMHEFIQEAHRDLKK